MRVENQKPVVLSSERRRQAAFIATLAHPLTHELLASEAEAHTPNHEQGKHSMPGLPALQQYRMTLGTHRTKYINQYHTAHLETTLQNANSRIMPL